MPVLPPAERTEIALEASRLEGFVGRYNLSPTDVVISPE
jgi:hypothetical protein